MQVRHLVVIATGTFNAIDEETAQSARALYIKHGSKSESAILLHSKQMFCTKVGDFAYMAQDTEIILKSGNSPVQLEKEVKHDEEEEEEEVQAKQVNYNNEIGVYLVFHSDDNEDGGLAIDPEFAANFLATILPSPLCKGIGKIALIACNSWTPFRGGLGGKGDLESLEGTPVDKARKHQLKMGCPLVLTLTIHLVDRDIRPQVCGFDIPIFIGGGGEFKVQSKQRQTWSDPRDLHPLDQLIEADGSLKDPLAASKLMLGRSKGVKMPLGHRPTQKDAHKKVMRIDDHGRLAFGLAGWSDKVQ